MKQFLKIIAWLFLLVCVAIAIRTVLGATFDGQFDFGTVTVNGREVHGAEKLAVGSIGLLVAAVAILFALAIAAVAIIGSGILVFAMLALAALMVIAVTVPFLLPFAIPVIVVAFLVAIAAKSASRKNAVPNQ